MHITPMYTAKEALQLLLDGNKRYIDNKISNGDISKAKREDTLKNGQHPYAIIVACSDSRVIPEAIFDCGIGDIFVIRVAGNVIDDHQLGSIEYAAGHLGAPIVMVLGHTHCGAVDAAMNHDPDGYIKFITDEIRLGIGDEKDERTACCLNVEHSLNMIQASLEIEHYEEADGLCVIGAIYDIETGEVSILRRYSGDNGNN